MNASTDKPPAFAKIARPRLNRPLLRPRLFARLDELRRAAITWVAGPPGAGKTTLISSYLAERGLAVLWYQLDADDADVATFFHYLGLAVQQAAVRGPRVLPSLTPERLPGLMSFTRRFAEAIAEGMRLPAVIVLDNYELLPEQAVLHDVLRELATSLPLGLSLVVLSRTEPPPVYARLRLHQDLVVLGGTELDLTRDEAGALAAAREPGGSGGGKPRAGAAVDAARIERLLQESRGWVAGFVLLLADHGGGTDAADADLEGLHGKSQHLLFDYFATELLVRFEPPMQQALLRTALLPTMTVVEAEQMSGEATVGSVLAGLQRQNCFIVQRGQQQPVYEYHALFRAFLLSRAAAQIPAGEWRALQCRAAELLAPSQPDAAAGLYRAAQHWPGLAALVLGEAAALVSAGRHRTLARWLDHLPGEMVEASAWLGYWRGAALMPFDAAAARAFFEQAYSGFRRDGDAAGLYAAWASVMESFFFEWRDFRPADRWIVEFENLRARHPEFPSKAVELRTYWAMGTLLHRQPQHALLPAWAQRVQVLLDGSQGNEGPLPSFLDPLGGPDAKRQAWGRPERELSVLIAGYLVIWFLWHGQTLQARGVIDRVAPWTGPATSPMVFILWSCAVGLHHSVQGETEDCRQAVQAGLALAQRTGLHAFDFMLCAQMARCCLVAGDTAAAEAWLATMASHMHSHSHIDGAFYRHLQCNAAAQRGDWQQATEHARAALAMGLEAGVPFLEAHCRIDLARALLGGGDGAEWGEQLRLARAIGQAIGSRVVEGLCLEAQAMAALREGAGEGAHDALAQAFAASRALDGITWQMAGPMARARLCDQALAAGIETDHVQRLVRRHRLVPPEPATAAEAWPWPVRLYTLGRFEIVCDDEPLRSAGKVQRKPLELLKCLCAFGGRAVNQDRITDALWPDTEGDAADQALRTTLHRLRKLLKHEQAVRLEDRQLHLDPRLLWADCLAFDQVAQHPERADIAQLQRALSRYRGPFLQGESAHWALALREQLRARFITLAERLGALLEAQGNGPATLDCYLRAIELEPGAEIFYRRLMASYARLGRRAEALAVYQRCRLALLTRLGVSPAAETQALHRQLVDC